MRSQRRAGAPRRGGGRRRRAAWASVGVAALIVLALLLLRSRSAPPRLEAAARRDAERAAPRRPLAASATAVGTWTGSGAAGRREPSVAERRLARAVATLETYAHATRYPPGSRPLRENPDQERPHWVPKVTYPLARRDGRIGRARVTIHQDRRYLAGDEAAILSLRCEDAGGPRRCDIEGAWARSLETPLFTGAPGGVPVAFADGGDGWYSAVFRPATQGFAGSFGVLRIDVALRVGEEQGATGFQLEYTPHAPARFTGSVRETIEHGSVVLHLVAEVGEPGRYVVTGRVDDARGDPFALLTFNDVLAAGRQEVPLVVFGKLMRDERPEQPCRLRDVEGFLLLEDAMPDRAMMASLDGVVHVLRVHPESELSEGEWESEERSRHLAQYAAEIERATRGGE